MSIVLLEYILPYAEIIYGSGAQVALVRNNIVIDMQISDSSVRQKCMDEATAVIQ